MISSKFNQFLGIILLVLALSSCNAHKKIPYLIDAETITEKEFAAVAESYEAKIMPKDILSIIVRTPTNLGASEFNQPIVTQTATSVIETYLVDNDGYVTIPLLGRIEIGGLTKNEAQKKIYNQIYPQYLTEEPVISIRFMNFRVAVIGEVNQPGIYGSVNEQMTILDAIASAGDLTIHGKRENILLIRENAEGERKVFTINLQDKNVLLNNEIYYLQQNDKLIVSPNKAKGNSASFGALESLALSGLSLLISVVAIITR